MGLYFRVVIPGYGAIVNNAGMIRTQLNFETGKWEVLQVTPNWNDAEQDYVQALCSFMGNR